MEAGRGIMNREMIERKAKENEKRRIEEKIANRLKEIKSAINSDEESYKVKIYCDNCTAHHIFCIKKGYLKDIIFKAGIKCDECECQLKESYKGRCCD